MNLSMSMSRCVCMRWDVGKPGAVHEALETKPSVKARRRPPFTSFSVVKSRELLDTAAGPTVAHVHAHALTRIQSYATLKGPADAQ